MRPTVDAVAPGAYPLASSRVGRFRWVICALLFFITTINYMDRQIIGVLKPVLAQDLHWSEIDYGNIVFFFQLAYAAGYVGMGRLMDLVGVRVGLTVAVIIWSLAAAGHGLARSVFGFGLARFLLGIGEGGNFPAAIKTVAMVPGQGAGLRDRHLQRREQRRCAADAAARALDRHHLGLARRLLSPPG